MRFGRYTVEMTHGMKILRMMQDVDTFKRPYLILVGDEAREVFDSLKGMNEKNGASYIEAIKRDGKWCPSVGGDT